MFAVGVVDHVDGEPAFAEALCELPALFARSGDRADHPVRRRVLDGLAHGRRGGVGHHRSLDVRCKENGDRMAGPLTGLDEGPRLLDDLLVRPPGDEHAPERTRNGAHRRPRPDDVLRERERVLPELDRLAYCLDRLAREPARAVPVVLFDQFDPFRQPGVHELPSGCTRSC
jgi:hypothetical protein